MKLVICALLLPFCVLINADIFDKSKALFRESLNNMKDGFRLIKRTGNTWAEYAKNSTRKLKKTWKEINSDEHQEENEKKFTLHQFITYESTEQPRAQFKFNSAKTTIASRTTEVPRINESLIREEILELQNDLMNITGIKKGIKAKIDDLMSVLHELKLNRTRNQIT